jgi:hypothetical protein
MAMKGYTALASSTVTVSLARDQNSTLMTTLGGWGEGVEVIGFRGV